MCERWGAPLEILRIRRRGCEPTCQLDTSGIDRRLVSASWRVLLLWLSFSTFGLRTLEDGPGFDLVVGSMTLASHRSLSPVIWSGVASPVRR